MGVRRAVDIVLDIAQHEKNRRIYTYEIGRASCRERVYGTV